MRRKSVNVLSLLAALSLLLAACNTKTGGPPRNAAVVDVVANANLTAWLKSAADQFNAAGIKTASGKPAYAQVTFVEAGQAVSNMTGGQNPPALWIPDDESWPAVLASKGQAGFQGNCQSVAQSPLVIAMWRPIAESLGWPGRSLGWLDIGSLAADPSSWSYYTGDKYGATLRVGHAHPGLSASGIDTLLAIVHAARSKPGALAVSDVQDPIVQASVAAFEGTVATFSQSTDKLGQTLKERGIDYLGAAVVYESTVVAYGGGSADGLVALYPFEGTFMSTNPACLNSGADAEAQEAARLFRDYLLQPEAQKAALANGLRPVNSAVPIGAPLDAAHGVDPARTKVIFNAPDAETVFAASQLWQSARKPINLVMLLDTSGSMQGSKIDSVRGAAVQFVKQMGDEDYLTLITFASRTNVLIEHRKVSEVREEAVQRIEEIEASGNTTLYDTIGRAAQVIQRTNSSQTSNAMVVLTDGQDTSSKNYSFGDLLINAAAANNTTVFTIAYGDDADKDVLSDLAGKAQGNFYLGNEANIAGIYQEMSAAFGGSVGIGR
jgi:Ca-activated chloride channel family protein